MLNKIEGGPFGIFQHPFCRKSPKKLKLGNFEEKNVSENKVLLCRKKTEKGDPLVSFGIV